MKPSCLYFLMAIVLFGCSKDDQKPKACFEISSTSIKVGDTIKLNNCSENSKSFIWIFGDGTESFEKAPLHSFSNNGIYSVKLLSVNENLIDSISKTINVSYSGFYFAENFEEAKTNNNWILLDLYRPITFDNYMGSKALHMLTEYCWCEKDHGSAIRNITNLEGKKKFKISVETNYEGKIDLIQMRNGNMISYNNQKNYSYNFEKISLTASFELRKTDTLQIILSYKYGGMISGPYDCYFDNIIMFEE